MWIVLPGIAQETGIAAFVPDYLHTSPQAEAALGELSIVSPEPFVFIPFLSLSTEMVRSTTLQHLVLRAYVIPYCVRRFMGTKA